MSTLPIPHSLAPLQRVMLRDSLLAPHAGCHVEQVEIRFSRSLAGGRIISAWKETVGETEALRLAFLVEDEAAGGWEFVTPGDIHQSHGPAPACWDDWLENDRHRPLLFPHAVPWRAAFWPEEMRFVWTFHHALLDGRSIARILHGFLKRVAGEAAGPLALAKWPPPTAEMRSLGDTMFRRVFADMEAPSSAPEEDFPNDTPAVRRLGDDILRKLESRAAAGGVTPATLLIESWGKALARRSGAASVVVEQVRSGPPQPGTAGFTMNLLPLRLGQGDVGDQLADLRRIESLGAEDLPPGVFPDVNGPWSSVIMVERGTLAHQVGAREFVESIILHEHKGESLSATAHLLPDLRLEVEGPGRHELLERWIRTLDGKA
ncbi:hypothetical protein JIN84_02770 [Luteolibacter yonseiensis]|uniref:Condensation domain-containing protein n=1 Tax=Luteolibacter yonseiensis TaxID=1144680 RepID=A0A934V9V0_9BACT|nr:hypothetical protein [Luteolibacter yonseiensis]MBK1814520.1 hypothetical protein [Luteolibacter yonseiensis]